MGDLANHASILTPLFTSLSQNSSETSQLSSRRVTIGDTSSPSSLNNTIISKNTLERNPSSEILCSSSSPSAESKILSNTPISVFSLQSQEDPGAIHPAAYNGNSIRIIELLRNHSIPINSKDELGRTALDISILYSKPIITSLLLSLGANPNCQDSEGNTAMHYAILTGSYKVARELMFHKSDLHIKNNSGVSPYNMIPYKDDKRFNIFKVNFISAEESV